jgi:hypothetical protein
MEGVGFSPVTRSRRRRCLLLGGLSGANSARRWTLAIRESTACQVDKLQASFEFRYKTEGYRMHGERRVLTSGAEGDPSLSFSTLPISRSEITASGARLSGAKPLPHFFGFVSAPYTCGLLNRSVGGWPSPNILWVIPTKIRSYVGSAQNHVSAAPSQ